MRHFPDYTKKYVKLSTQKITATFTSIYLQKPNSHSKPLCAQLEKKVEFLFFFFISNKPIKHFLITVRINKTRLELGTVCLSLNVKEKGLSGEKKAWSTLVLLQKIKRNRQNKSLSAYFLIKYTFWTSLKPLSSLGSFSDINTELRLRKS